MTLSDRLTRAGLSFIVFGTAVSLMPTNGNAIADTLTCGGGDKYRLTTDFNGKYDLSPSPSVTSATSETFYLFISSDNGSTYTAFTQGSFTSTGYTSVTTNGNTFTGTTAKGSNTVTANVTGGLSLSDGTVTSSQ